jgi:hypothetical protein
VPDGKVFERKMTKPQVDKEGSREFSAFQFPKCEPIRGRAAMDARSLAFRRRRVGKQLPISTIATCSVSAFASKLTAQLRDAAIGEAEPCKQSNEARDVVARYSCTP